MAVKITSEKLLATFKGLSDKLAGKHVGAALTLTPETQFVAYQELGTATLFDGEGTDAPASHAPGGITYEGGVRLPATAEYANTNVLRGIGAPFTNPNPGVRPKNFIRGNYEELFKTAYLPAITAFQQGQYDTDAMQQNLETEGMKDIKEMIAVRIAEELGTPDREFGAKLNGAAPAEVFFTQTEIIPIP